MGCGVITTQAQQMTPQYKIHETPSTKTIVIDGGALLLCPFSNDRACVKWKKGWFVIDSEGNKVFDLPQGYKPKGWKQNLDGDFKCMYDHNRLMVFSQDKKCAIIYDENGNVVKNFDNIKNASAFVDGVALLKTLEKKPGQYLEDVVWCYIDTLGNILSKNLPGSGYSSTDYRVFPYRNDLAAVYDSKKGCWGFRNRLCQWAFEPIYGGFGADDGGGFYHGLSRARDKQTDKWGYINISGKWVIQPMFTNRPGNFVAGGVALVTDKSECHHLIDKTGKIIWTDPNPRGRRVYREFNKWGYAIWCYGDNEIIVDEDVKTIAKLQLPSDYLGSDVVEQTKNYFQYFVSYNEENLLFDWNGNLLLVFDGRDVFSNDMCSYDKRCYFNSRGEIIVKFVDTMF